MRPALSDRYERWKLKQPGMKKLRSYRRCSEAAEEMLALTITTNARNLIEAEDPTFGAPKFWEGDPSSDTRWRPRVAPNSNRAVPAVCFAAT
jgi:hypothetical protein